MLNFVKKEQLDFMLGNGLSDENLRRQLRPQAEIAPQSAKSNVSSDLVMRLAFTTW